MAGPHKIEITQGKVVQTHLMSPATKAQYEGLLASGDRLYDAGQQDAAQARWSEADALAEPYIKRQPEKKDETPPPPASANPPPPEFIPDTSEAIAVCTAPDVCRSPNVPVPYMVWGKADDDLNYSPDVRSNGLRIKRADSRFTTTYGDEPGTGLGVVSNTVGHVIEPTSWSGTVRANGIPVERHGDSVKMNNGNTVGEYVHVKSVATHPAPDGNDDADRKKSALQHFWDGTKSTSDTAAAGEGVVKKLGDWWNDPSQIGRDAASAWDSLPTAGEAWQGTKDFTTGAARGAAHVASEVWNDPVGSAESAGGWAKDQAVGAYEGVANAYEKGGVPMAAGAAVGVVVDAVNPLKKVERGKHALDALDEAGDAKRKADNAKGEARSTRKPSLRDQYLGDTPGKNSRTGDDVRERMRKDGEVRTDPDTGLDEFRGEDGKWYPVDSTTTHMGHHPKDAVDYWNETGRNFGAKSPEVRQWMRDSNNYRFEHGPLNSSRGGSTKSRYLPPVEK